MSWGYSREGAEPVVRTMLRMALMHSHVQVQTATEGPWKEVADHVKKVEGGDFRGSELCKAAFHNQPRQQRQDV